MLWFLRIAFAVVGIGLVLYASTMPGFVDKGIFESKVSTMYPERDVSNIERLNKDFNELRDRHLTSKYQFQDYALSSLLFCIILCALGFGDIHSFSEFGKLRAPATAAHIRFLGVFIALVSIAFSWASTIIDFNRWIAPPWADSPGAPMGEALVGGIIFGTFNLLISIVLRYNPLPNLNILPTLFDKSTTPLARWWILLGAFLSFAVFLLVASLILGAWHQIIPAGLWALFFLFLLAGKQRKLVVEV